MLSRLKHLKKVKSPKTTFLAFVNIALVVAGMVFMWAGKITHEELIIFMTTVTSVITSLIGYFTKDEEKDICTNDRTGTDRIVQDKEKIG